MIFFPPSNSSSSSFDATTMPSHGLGSGNRVKELGDALGSKRFYSIPGSGGVTLVGHGYQGEDHYGLKDVTLRAMSHTDYHADPLSAEEIENGRVRFNTFHFDGIIYRAHPSHVITFRCVRSPKGPDITIQWDDGTEIIMQCQPRSTAFISSAQLYNALTDEEKKVADHRFWEPAPYPFAWSGSRKCRWSGFGLAPGGKTIPLDELPDWTSDKIFKVSYDRAQSRHRLLSK